jgi:hypothetical protein
MRGKRRFGLGVTAATAVALIGLAGPAQAQYRAEPRPLAWNPAGPVHSLLAGNNVVYVGGKLNGTGGIAAVSSTTGALLWMVPTDKDVRALALSPDGSTLYAGGAFTTVDGTARRGLVALDVDTHSIVSSWNGGARGPVRDLIATGGDVYVAGKITRVGGVVERGIGALDATTGKHDGSFDFSADNDVLGLALTGNQLILSGSFTQINGSPRANLASINLSSNTLTGWSPGKLCKSCDQYWDVQTDGVNAYVSTSGNSGAAYKLSTGALAWPSIRGTGDFQAVGLPGDGFVYFGGHFGLGVWTGAAPQNKVPAKQVVSVSTATGQIDPSWLPRQYTNYPGTWAFTSTPGNLWAGGDFTGEAVNGSDNHKPYLAAYPDSNADHTPPTGSFHTTQSSAWAKLTKVQVVQTAIHDDTSRNGAITRRVAWGDGTKTNWTRGTTLTHVYKKGGTFTPRVTLTDEAGNSSGPIMATRVVVKVDRTGPVVKLQLPGHRHSLASWKTLRGTATDAGTGVRKVKVQAVERRGTTWFGYNAKTHRWTKATTKAQAFAKARALKVKPNSRHQWAAKVAHLHQGTLVYTVSATDRVANTSATLTHKAEISHL